MLATKLKSLWFQGRCISTVEPLLCSSALLLVLGLVFFGSPASGGMQPLCERRNATPCHQPGECQVFPLLNSLSPLLSL